MLDIFIKIRTLIRPSSSLTNLWCSLHRCKKYVWPSTLSNIPGRRSLVRDGEEKRDARGSPESAAYQSDLCPTALILVLAIQVTQIVLCSTQKLRCAPAEGRHRHPQNPLVA